MRSSILSSLYFKRLDPIYAKSITAAPAIIKRIALSDYDNTAAISTPSNFEDVVPIDPWPPLDQANGAFKETNNSDLLMPTTVGFRHAAAIHGTHL